jgi:hypothetical protein
MDRANKARLIGSVVILLVVGAGIIFVELASALKDEILSIRDSQ